MRASDNKKQTMRTQIALLSKLAACAILVVGISGANAADKKADPSGTWSWTMQRRGGGQGNADAPPRKVTLKLKAEGDKLTGSVSQPAFGRRGGDGGGAPPAPVETKISNGKINGDQISFDVTREFNGNSFTAKYSGKVEGDTIKGKVETERNGQANSRDWEAKRDK
jgi:hypothetical protein